MMQNKLMTRHVSKFLFAAIFAVLALLAVVVSPLFAVGQQAEQPAPTQTSSERAHGNAFAPERRVPQSQSEIQLSYAPLVQQVSPAVVNVYTSRVVRESASPFANDPIFRQFFGATPQARERVQNSLGSGVIVSEDGVIVTNSHVVKDADQFLVVL